MDTTSVTKVVIEHGTNTTVRCYNVAAQLSELSIANFSLPISTHWSEFDSIGGVARKLLLDIQDGVPGVEMLYIERYSLTVCVNRAFCWDDIEPRILTAIAKAVGTELDVSTDEWARSQEVVMVQGFDFGEEEEEEEE